MPKYILFFVSTAGTTGMNMSILCYCCVSFVKQFQWGYPMVYRFFPPLDKFNRPEQSPYDVIRAIIV